MRDKNTTDKYLYGGQPAEVEPAAGVKGTIIRARGGYLSGVFGASGVFVLAAAVLWEERVKSPIFHSIALMTRHTVEDDTPNAEAIVV